MLLKLESILILFRNQEASGSNVRCVFSAKKLFVLGYVTNWKYCSKNKKTKRRSKPEPN